MPWPGPVSDEPPHPVRVVLDTNVLVSALLFRQSRLSWIRLAWQNPAAGRILRPVLGPATTRELIRVLGYPKFQLSQGDVTTLLEDILPFAETVASEPPPLQWPRDFRDADDRIILDLTVAAGVEVLVSGDADLLVLAGQLEDLEILSPAQFVSWWKHLPHQTSPR